MTRSSFIWVSSTSRLFYLHQKSESSECHDFEFLLFWVSSISFKIRDYHSFLSCLELLTSFNQRKFKLQIHEIIQRHKLSIKNEKFSLRMAFVREKWVFKIKTWIFFKFNSRRVIKFYRLCKKIKSLFQPHISIRLPCLNMRQESILASVSY